MSLLLLFSGGPSSLPPELDGFYDLLPAEDYSVSMRKELYDFLVDARDNDLLLLPDIDIVESYLPFDQITTLKANSPNGKLYLTLLPTDEETQSRAALSRTEVGVLFSFMMTDVLSSDTAAIDNLVNFIGQLKFSARRFLQVRDDLNYSWNRIEAMKDPEGTPYGFVTLAQTGVFHSYFVAYYTYLMV